MMNTRDDFTCSCRHPECADCFPPAASAKVLELAFRKCLADKFYIGPGLRKLTLDADPVTEAMDEFIRQARDGWEDHKSMVRHEK